ncbi:MAG TPA: Uma2 family endonuclease [Chloroflexota bacterium]|nr:Uma2 family endonuclease [Chloroflexota bacterium]
MATPQTAFQHQSEGARQHLEELARRAADPEDPMTITYEEFLEWADEDTRAEWVDGKIEMSSPASLRHQQIGLFLVTVNSMYARVLDLGTVLPPPFQMKLPLSGREPDLIFIAKQHEERIRNTFVDGPVDLAVEIVSPESVKRDRETKLREYGQGGVGEYWLVDPRKNEARFYQLDASGAYIQMAPDAAGTYRSRALPGFWLEVAWLWRDPLPDVIVTLSAIAGDAFRRYVTERLQQG